MLLLQARSRLVSVVLLFKAAASDRAPSAPILLSPYLSPAQRRRRCSAGRLKRLRWQASRLARKEEGCGAAAAAALQPAAADLCCQCLPVPCCALLLLLLLRLRLRLPRRLPRRLLLLRLGARSATAAALL
jgi:hypothetical protein